MTPRDRGSNPTIEDHLRMAIESERVSQHAIDEFLKTLGYEKAVLFAQLGDEEQKRTVWMAGLSRGDRGDLYAKLRLNPGITSEEFKKFSTTLENLSTILDMPKSQLI